MFVFSFSRPHSLCSRHVLIDLDIAHRLDLPELVRQMTEPHVDEGQDDGAAHDHKQSQAEIILEVQEVIKHRLS